MTRKEGLFAVIGGVVGAVLVMVAGSIAPLGAQNEVKDAEFQSITCNDIQVVDRLGNERISVSALVGWGAIDMRDGNGKMFFGLNDLTRSLALYGTSEKPGLVSLGIDKDGDGGYATLLGKGAIGVLDKDGYRRETLK